MNKASSTREGEATFYRTSRFKLAARQDLVLKDCFKDLLQQPKEQSSAASQPAQHAERAKRHAQFEPMLRSSPRLQQVLQGVATVAQMTLLQPVTQADPLEAAAATPSAHVQSLSTPDISPQNTAAADGSLCVVNSHFFFHPRASHVRNIHAAAVMSEVEAFIDNTRSTLASPDVSLATAATAASAGVAFRDSADSLLSPGKEIDVIQRPALLFCGDFNSDLNDGTPGNALSYVHCKLIRCVCVSCSMLMTTKPVNTACISLEASDENHCCGGL